jgi:hypothetical protein
VYTCRLLADSWQSLPLSWREDNLRRMGCRNHGSGVAKRHKTTALSLSSGAVASERMALARGVGRAQGQGGGESQIDRGLTHVNDVVRG